MKKTGHHSFISDSLKTVEGILYCSVSKSLRVEIYFSSVQFSSFQLLSRVRFFATLWTAACQGSMSLTISWNLPKFRYIASGDSIQPSYPLTPSSPTLNLSQHQCFFQWVSCLHQVAKILELQLQCQSLKCIFRVDFL